MHWYEHRDTKKYNKWFQKRFFLADEQCDAKHKDIKLVTTEARRIYLVSKPNYHITIFFFRKFISHRNEKAQILTNKSVYLDLSILEISKVVMYKFWYEYVKISEIILQAAL